MSQTSLPQHRDAGRHIEARLPGKMRARIQMAEPGFTFDETVYALNWFNTRFAWVYDFYNLVAGRSVTAIGGTPFFKARIVEELHGTTHDLRDVVLIVRYPALTKFKDMLESRYFQLVSLLRIFAVRDFSFGFSKRCDGDLPARCRTEPATFSIHHFRGDAGLIEEITAMSTEAGLEVVFAGRVFAHIATARSGSEWQTTDCVMDAMIVLASPDRSLVDRLVQSDSYRLAMQKAQSSFAGLYERLI